MASSHTTKNLQVLLIVLLGTVLLGSTVKAQAGSCSVCKPDECCSQYGYCGKNTSFCGEGCQAGPCLNPTNGVSVGDLVTQQFFDGIANKGKANNKDCPGQNFYSRGVFLEALKSYPRFGRTGSVDDSKREIAAFFAHITHESGYFCYMEETGNKNDNYCDPEKAAEYPCAPGKRYNGRGPLQLTWNYNYGAAGKENNFDGLKSPEIVSTNPLVSFKAALWFWMKNVRPVISQGFGATIEKINGDVECKNKEPIKVKSRIDLYKNYCSQFGVAPGGNLSC
ncbi:hypothetical protein UlMin_016399 [Ulmus minor]